MIRLVSTAFLDSWRSLRSIARGTTAALAASTALATLAACGDPLVTSGYRGDPIFAVQGTVTQGLLEEAPSTSQEVGVLWLNLLDDNSSVLVEATPADVIGNEFPAGFDVSVLAPPSDRMLGTALISYGPGGNSEQPIDRNRVAFGIVVVATEGTFARLPTETSLGEFINSSSATPGPLLSQFTYVSPFTVRYVKDADVEEVILRDINGVESVLQDFTIFDIGKWAKGTENAVCRDRRLGEGWQTPEVQACIADKSDELAEADARQQACIDACGAPPENASDEERQGFSDCQFDCYLTENGRQAIENNCLNEWSLTQAEETDAVCGPQPDFAESDFRNSRRLEEGEEVTLPLGDGDVRNALTFGGFTFLG